MMTEPLAAPGTSERPSSRTPTSWAALGVAGGCYLVRSLVVWWGIWSTHPSSVTVCGCGDESLFLWMMEWPAYALTHGQSLFYSHALFHPQGFNLLDETSVLAFSVPLVPVTWAFGPVASENLVLLLGPVLGALSMFWFVRRFVAWWPAPFVAGLLAGFSLLTIGTLTAGWTTHLFFVFPLLAGVLDELLFVRRRSPVVLGALLGLLVVLQFFISTEFLAIGACTFAGALVVIGLWAVLFHRVALRAAAPRLGRGALSAVVVGGVLLAYPVWFAFAGPGHLVGAVWPGYPAGLAGVAWRQFFVLGPPHALSTLTRLFGGYQGTPLEDPEYVGVAVIAVLIAGLALWRRDRRLQLFVLLAVVAGLCSLTIVPGSLGHGVGGNGALPWVPWDALRYVPVLSNALPARFLSMVVLCVAVAIGLILGHVRTSSEATLRARGLEGQNPGPWRSARLWASLLGLAAAGISLWPLGSQLVGHVPLVTQDVVVPKWFLDVGPHLPPGEVLVTYPAANGGAPIPAAWQAIDKMSFSLVGGTGPAGVPQRVPIGRAGYVAWGALSEDLSSSVLQPRTIGALRTALHGWGTTLVVIPDQPELPAYATGQHTGAAVALVTAALGEAPRYEARAWVWSVPRVLSSPRPITQVALQACIPSGNFPTGRRDRIPRCVLAAQAVHDQTTVGGQG